MGAGRAWWGHGVLQGEKEGQAVGKGWETEANWFLFICSMFYPDGAHGVRSSLSRWELTAVQQPLEMKSSYCPMDECKCFRITGKQNDKPSTSINNSSDWC